MAKAQPLFGWILPQRGFVMSEKRSAAYRLSVVVGVVLAILTIVEYFAAIYMPSTVVLFLLALFKAVAVLNYFMHVSRLWRQEEGH
jgi:cytochrome c oxidase subunit 4